MVGLSPGNDFYGQDEYSTRRWAMTRQSGRTAATSECSRTLSLVYAKVALADAVTLHPLMDMPASSHGSYVFLVDGIITDRLISDCSRKMALPMHVLDQDNFTNTDDASSPSLEHDPKVSTGFPKRSCRGFHSITSSRAARNESGIVSPSIIACRRQALGISQGAKPADLPICSRQIPARRQSADSEMLGLTIPDSFLLRADEVIE